MTDAESRKARRTINDTHINTLHALRSHPEYWENADSSHDFRMILVSTRDIHVLVCDRRFILKADHSSHSWYIVQTADWSIRYFYNAKPNWKYRDPQKMKPKWSFKFQGDLDIFQNDCMVARLAT